jgi:uncharacterized protein (TIGR03067 family)
MPNTANHPTDATIEAFALGSCPEDPAVEAHLAGCETCQRRAEAVAPDTLVELLAAALTHADAPTSTLDAAATPPAFAPTLAWTDAAGPSAVAPPALAGHPKYRVVRRLGVGGMGTVWLAEHAVMDRPVAVKVIRPDLLAKPGAADRFLREVRAAARLHHSNIVTAFDAEPAGDAWLLAMEYVPGETLAERLTRGPLPAVEACRAVRDAACGLAHAHAAGLVHRDVKPHNLIRAADGTVKVLDFGLAGVVAGKVTQAGGTGLTGAGMVVGTPDYIAPEQIADPRSADARADLYGLGCTLYHLLAGRPPFPEGSIMHKLTAQQERDPDPIPGLPPGLAAVVAKLMAKRPEDRYQSADEVVAALEPFLHKRAPKLRRNGPFIAVAAGLLSCIVFGAFGVVFKIQRDNQEITITTDDADVEVVMKRKGEVVLIRDAKSGQTWTFDVLKNQIGQAETKDGLTLGLSDKEPFVLRRNGTAVFTVTRLQKPADGNRSAANAQPAKPVPDTIAAVTKAADAWLKLIDEGKYAAAWEQSDSTARQRRPKEEFVRTYEKTAQQFGKRKSRVLVGASKRANNVFIVYTSSFENLTEATEHLWMKLDVDGEWRALSYTQSARPASGEPDRELIQGAWKPVTVQVMGQPAPELLIQAIGPTITFAAGKKVTWAANPTPEAKDTFGQLLTRFGLEGTFELDPTRSPKSLTITILTKNAKTPLGTEAPRAMLGIYRFLDADTLEICMVPDPDHPEERPTKFETAPNKFIALATLKRVPAKTPAERPK